MYIFGIFRANEYIWIMMGSF